jgi:hypothetical protein
MKMTLDNHFGCPPPHIRSHVLVILQSPLRWLASMHVYAGTCMRRTHFPMSSRLESRLLLQALDTSSVDANANSRLNDAAYSRVRVRDSSYHDVCLCPRQVYDYTYMGIPVSPCIIPARYCSRMYACVPGMVVQSDCKSLNRVLRHDDVMDVPHA